MKNLLITLFPLLISLAAHCQEGCPNPVVSGDFDGNGTTESLDYFLADSLGNRVAPLKETEGETWDEHVYNFSKAGYQMVITLPNSATRCRTHRRVV